VSLHKSLVRRIVGTLRKQTVVFVGVTQLGAFRIRGAAVAKPLGAAVCEPWQMPRTRTAVLVKSAGEHVDQVRSRCDRLLFDMLDAWMQDDDPCSGIGYAGPSEDYYRDSYKRIRFDTLLVPTPSAKETAERVLPCSVQVVLAPHQADESVHPEWYDPAGPIVYVGGAQYIHSQLEELTNACQSLNKRLLIGKSPAQLRGASLALALRLPPYDTPMNRIAKPQVKLENAAAAGLPVLASAHECVQSWRPETTVWNERDSDSLSERLAIALESRPLQNPVRLEDHCRLMEQVIGERRGA
jgi:hypothetical protein